MAATRASARVVASSALWIAVSADMMFLSGISNVIVAAKRHKQWRRDK